MFIRNVLSERGISITKKFSVSSHQQARTCMRRGGHRALQGDGEDLKQ